METEKKKKATTTPLQDEKVVEMYLKFCDKTTRQMDGLTRYLEGRSFNLNKKAVKETDKYFKDNPFDGDLKRTQEILDFYKSLAKITDVKYSNRCLLSQNNINTLNINLNQFDNISRQKILNMFTDKDTVVANYSLLNIRILAYYCKDEALYKLIKIYDDKTNGYDNFYSLLASYIFDKDYFECCERDTDSKYASSRILKQRAKKAMMCEIYRCTDIESSIKKDIKLLEDKFPQLKMWIASMKNYKKNYIQDIFGNIKTLDKYSIQNLNKGFAIPNLITLTETSMHKLFISKLYEYIVDEQFKINNNLNIDIRLPLLHYFILETQDKKLAVTLLNMIFCDLFYDYGFKLEFFTTYNKTKLDFEEIE